MREEWAEALRLVEDEGYSYPDAALIAGVPIGTFMARLHHGRLQYAAVMLAKALTDPVDWKEWSEVINAS